MPSVKPWCAGLLALAGFAPGCRVAPVPSMPAGPVVPAPRLDEVTEDTRLGYIRRAQVWHRIDTAALDLKAGPQGPGSFPFEAEIDCEYRDVPRSGKTPKFACRSGDEEYKVKYGEDNGEVFAEVAASRLFWALGFGTDDIYPVRVTCHGCPVDPWLWKTRARIEERQYQFATIERRFEAQTIAAGDVAGWRWAELDIVDTAAGGAPLEHREALKLLAVFVQHGDNRQRQQRLVCLPHGVSRDPGGERCERPFLVVSDVGGTFGRGGWLSGEGAKLHFRRWSTTPVFRDAQACIGELQVVRWDADLQHPKIREAGRRFLSERLALLSDQQIRDLFVAARADLRGGTIEENGIERPVTIDDWVEAFQWKRRQIAESHCPE